eukprot:TRINITY_DN1606_c0_g2_i1.p1 TRINITY_DN1606_c0_g2~~TRINITY_DN1606_c0_g2_i1.p1  ORF type:complete len:500 (+),score=145.12 TRINITY_DN1606_c0_g2_i1:91-1590(+)
MEWVAFLAVCLAAALWALRAGRPVTGGRVVTHSRSLPFVGLTVEMVRKVVLGRMPFLQFHLEEFARNGNRPYSAGAIGGLTVVILTDHRDVKYIHKDAFAGFEKGPKFQTVLKDLLGGGIFNVDGKLWKEQRNIAHHMFAKRRLREHVAAVYGSHSQVLAHQIARQADAADVDLKPLFASFTFDTICMAAFGRRPSALEGDPDAAALQHHFDNIQTLIVNRFMLPWWRLSAWLQLSEAERSLTASLKAVDAQIYGMLEAHDGRGDSGTLLDLFLGAITDDKGAAAYAEPKFLRDVMLNFFLAGRDTTASALGSTILLLCQHPAWQAKVAAEAKQVFAALGSVQEPLGYDDVSDPDAAPVAEACFLEAIRLRPPVPTNEKSASEDCTLPSGVVVPKGTVCGWNCYAVQTDPAVWGDDACRFDPGRWLTGDARAKSDFMYPAFNAGYRLCLGKSTAVLQGKMALLTLFARWRFELAEDFKEVPVLTITHQLESLRVRAIPL